MKSGILAACRTLYAETFSYTPTTWRDQTVCQISASYLYTFLSYGKAFVINFPSQNRFLGFWTSEGEQEKGNGGKKGCENGMDKWGVREVTKCTGRDVSRNIPCGVTPLRQDSACVSEMCTMPCPLGPHDDSVRVFLDVAADKMFSVKSGKNNWPQQPSLHVLHKTIFDSIGEKGTNSFFATTFEKFGQLFIFFGMNHSHNPCDWKIEKISHQYLHDTK